MNYYVGQCHVCNQQIDAVIQTALPSIPPPVIDLIHCNCSVQVVYRSSAYSQNEASNYLNVTKQRINTLIKKKKLIGKKFKGIGWLTNTTELLRFKDIKWTRPKGRTYKKRKII